MLIAIIPGIISWSFWEEKKISSTLTKSLAKSLKPQDYPSAHAENSPHHSSHAENLKSYF